MRQSCSSGFLSKGNISIDEATRVTVDAYASDSSPNASIAANIFHENGVVNIRNLFPSKMMNILYAHALKNFISCLGKLQSDGIRLKNGTKHGYAEVVKRTTGRFELLYNMQDMYSSQLGLGLRESVFLHQFLSSNNVLGDGYHLIYCDLLISFPGAVDQQWHTDGSHRPGARNHLPAHVLNCFVALDDIEIDMGPTEIRPMTHKLTRDIKKQMLLALLRKKLRPRIRPECQSGDAVILYFSHYFDYRTLHRGVANTSKKPRPVLGLVFARDWFKGDKINFPPRSMFENDVVMSSLCSSDKQSSMENLSTIAEPSTFGIDDTKFEINLQHLISRSSELCQWHDFEEDTSKPRHI